MTELTMEMLEEINGGRRLPKIPDKVKNEVKDYVKGKIYDGAISILTANTKPPKVDIPKNVQYSGSYCYRG